MIGAGSIKTTKIIPKVPKIGSNGIILRSSLMTGSLSLSFKIQNNYLDKLSSTDLVKLAIVSDINAQILKFYAKGKRYAFTSEYPYSLVSTTEAKPDLKDDTLSKNLAVKASIDPKIGTRIKTMIRQAGYSVSLVKNDTETMARFKIVW